MVLVGWWVCWGVCWRWPRLSRSRRGRGSGIRRWAFLCRFGWIRPWGRYWFKVHRNEWTFIASRRVRLHTGVWFSNRLNHTWMNMTVGDTRYRKFNTRHRRTANEFLGHQSWLQPCASTIFENRCWAMIPYARVSAASCYVLSTLAMCAEEEAGI